MTAVIRYRCLAGITLLLVTPSAHAEPPPAARISELAASQLNSLVALYEHLHANPELSFEEEQTAAKLVSELEPLGFKVTTGVGGHGFVAVMENGEGPTVMVRTDLDGLPVEEETGLPYASRARSTNAAGQDVGVMHACGHDVHMTSFVGTGRLLAEVRGSWSGTLVMIGQPAEERGAGARAMLNDGLYERFPRPDYVLGLHANPVLEAGQIAYTEGYALANVDSVDITIRGVGGHGAYPHLGKDPIVIASQVVLALQTIVSREVRPVDPAVVTVGSIHGGTKHNVISDEVKLQLTVRTYSEQTREQVLSAIRRITVGIARAAGVPPEREPTVALDDREYTPALYNDPELARRVVAVFRDHFGEENVVERDPQMGGEDFARYGREEPKIPIFMFWLGTIGEERMAESDGPGGRPLPSMHSALYQPTPRPTIQTGVRAMTAAVLELMAD